MIYNNHFMFKNKINLVILLKQNYLENITAVFQISFLKIINAYFHKNNINSNYRIAIS